MAKLAEEIATAKVGPYAGGLAGGWVEAQDEEGNTYYYNGEARDSFESDKVIARCAGPVRNDRRPARSTELGRKQHLGCRSEMCACSRGHVP